MGTDSLYARNITLGVWKPRKRHDSSELIRRLRALWFRIQMKHGV